MKIRILTSCTGEKKHTPANQLTLADFRHGREHVRAREAELKDLLTPAGAIYTGEQHVRLMRGVDAARAAGVQCEVCILSAGYGFIPEDRLVAPYECTFATMKAKELREWAAVLQAPEGFRAAVAEPYDLGLILLGDKYLRACALSADLKLGGPTLLFTGTGPARRIPSIPNLRVMTLSNPEARRFSCALVGLKGEIAARILAKATADATFAACIMDPAQDVLALLDSGGATPAAGKPAVRHAKANPCVDRVIDIPESWWSKPHRQKLMYFIPEWDDLVDPDYDFLNDEHSGGTGDWCNQVYAHQMYPEPNYDGILMSRAVAEKSKRKKERINAMGVHRFLRVPKRFPIMGDCGAFDYIMEKVPPYTTDDVIAYYTRLGFNYGVSVDHLIVAATEADKEFRYELTIHNAEEFLKQHRAAKLPWTPIGAVQGWDPQSYAKAAAQYVKMGYNYIGLGGLVRTKSEDILKTLRLVRESVPSNVRIHLFGVARLNLVPDLLSAGLQSMDSASYLRQAWMRLHHSYASMSGPYAALRIPEAGKSFRAKHMLNHADLTDAKVCAMEEQALAAVRSFAEHRCSIDECIAALMEYDQFVTKERISMEAAYRRTLADRPWDRCDCAICRRWGVEVATFRGNNRNRRRGFHNTYVFYRLLQRVIATGDASFLSQEGEESGLTPEIRQLEFKFG